MIFPADKNGPSQCRLLALIAMACAIASGCVSAPRVMLPTVNRAGASTPVGHGIVVSLVRPSDERSDISTIGSRLTVDSQTATAYTTAISQQGNVPVWIGDAFTDGLNQDGFRVDKINTPAASLVPLVITIAVKKVWVGLGPSPSLGSAGRAEVAVNLLLYNRGQRVMKRKYSGRSEGSGTMFTPDATVFRNLLGDALNDMLRSAIPDLSAALVRESTAK